MSIAGASSVDVLPNPLSMIVRTMSIEMGAISLAAETRSAVGFINVKVITSTSKTVTVVTSETITVGTDYTVLGSAFEV